MSYKFLLFKPPVYGTLLLQLSKQIQYSMLSSLLGTWGDIKYKIKIRLVVPVSGYDSRMNKVLE